MGKLFNKEEKTKSSSKQRVDIPSWLKPYITDLPEQITEISEQEFTPYDVEDRLVDLTDDERAALDMIREQVAGVGTPFEDLIQRTAGLGQRYLEGPSAEELERRSNPYTEQVLDRVRAGIERGLGTELNQIGDAAAGAGAFGGARQGVYEAEAAGAASRNLADITAELMTDRFNQARQDYYQGLSGAFSSLQQEGAFQQQSLGDILQRAAALQSAGGTERTLDQIGKDLEYEEFLREEQYAPARQQYATDNLLNILNLVRGQSGESVSTTKESGNYLGKAVGMATSVMGAMGMGGGGGEPGGRISGASSQYQGLGPAPIAAPVTSTLRGLTSSAYNAPVYAQAPSVPQNFGNFASGGGLMQNPSWFGGRRFKDGGKVEEYQDGGFLGAALESLTSRGIDKLPNPGRGLRNFLESLDRADEEYMPVVASPLERAVRTGVGAVGDVGLGTIEGAGKAAQFLIDGITPETELLGTALKPRANLRQLSEEGGDLSNLSFEELQTINDQISQLQRRNLDDASTENANQLVEPLAALLPKRKPERAQEQKSTQPQKTQRRDTPTPVEVERKEPKRKRLEDRVNMPLLLAGAAMLQGDSFADSLAGGIQAYVSANLGLEEAEAERKKAKIEGAMAQAELEKDLAYIDAQKMFGQANLMKARAAMEEDKKEQQDPLKISKELMSQITDLQELAERARLEGDDEASQRAKSQADQLMSRYNQVLGLNVNGGEQPTGDSQALSRDILRKLVEAANK